MSIRHSVTLPDGTVATRTSENRVYSHVVVQGPEPKATVLERQHRTLSRMQSERAHSQRIVDYAEAGGEFTVNLTGNLFAPGLTDLDPYRGLGWTSHDGRFLGQEGDTFAEQVIGWFGQRNSIENIRKVEAEIQATESGPEWVGPWAARTWSSRLGLATKAAVKYQVDGREVRILETVRLAK
jgi:hypothetical protein